MKKILLALLLLCMAFSAQAEIVGRTSAGENIHAYTADNGQIIYFTALEPEPFIQKDDVNFDGAEDLVVAVGQGVNNLFCEFFIWNGENYVQSAHDGLEFGICNYQLYADKGLVVSYTNNGFAGEMHEWCFFRWEGTDLKMIRRATSEMRNDYIGYEDGYAFRKYRNQLMVTVQIRNNWTGMWDLVMSEIVPLEDESWYAREEKALWQGL